MTLPTEDSGCSAHADVLPATTKAASHKPASEIPLAPVLANSPIASQNRLDKDFLQNNIDRSIEYRKEYYKYNIGIATALLAFTVSFPSTLAKIDYPYLIFAAWAGLGVSILGAVTTHILWANFFITWRNYDNRGEREKGRAARAPITWWRRLFDGLQIIALIVGVGGVVVFAGLNLGNIAFKEKAAFSTAPAPSSTLAPPSTSPPSSTPTSSSVAAPSAPAPGNTGRNP